MACLPSFPLPYSSLFSTRYEAFGPNADQPALDTVEAEEHAADSIPRLTSKGSRPSGTKLSSVSKPSHLEKRAMTEMAYRI